MQFILKSLVTLTAISSSVSCMHYANNKQASTPYYNSSSVWKKSLFILNHIVRDLHFFPINSVRFRLSELKNIKATVIFMRDRSCVLSEQHGYHIARLEKKYSKKGVHFIYNYVGQENPRASAKRDLEKFGFKGPYLIDRKQTLINALSVHAAEEILILTPERRVIYKGALNSMRDVHTNGFHQKSDISDILDAMISEKKVIPKMSLSSICVIERPHIKRRVFYKDVAPIINRKCANCHNEKKDVPIDLSSYENIAGRHAMIRYVINSDLMPPWGVDPNTGPWKNDLSLTLYEKALLMKWLSSGLKKQPKKRFQLKKQQEKSIKHPDYIFKVPKTIIPKDGFLPLKTFYASIPFKEDKWLKEIQFITKPKVIHHLSFSLIPSKVSALNSKKNPGISHNLCLKSKRFKNFSGCVRSGEFWVPGREKYLDFMNSGIKVPKQGTLYVEIHYETIGLKVIDDTTEIRFIFHKKPPKFSWKSLIISDRSIKIPPQTSSYRNEITYTAREDLFLAALNPHMHLRGVASSLFIIDVLGNSKKIFSSSYNFNFQNRYFLSSPLKIQKGSVIKCVNWFDNSSENPINPNPNQNVIWGPKTENEMSGCFLSFIYPISKKQIELL